MEEIIAGIRTYYYSSSGNGKRNLVFLHGWGADHTCFLTIFERIRDRYNIYAPDLPGFGRTDEPDEVYDAHSYAAFVKAFISKLGIEDPVVIGHSNGGRISIVLSLIMKIEKMILVDSAGIRPRRCLSYYFKVWSYRAAKRVLLLSGEKGREKLRAYRQKKGSQDYRQASEKMKAVLVKLVNEDLRTLLPDITIPVLLFWGEKDIETPLSDAHIMKSLIKDSGLVIAKNAGHFSFLESAGLFVRVLDKFMED